MNRQTQRKILLQIKKIYQSLNTAAVEILNFELHNIKTIFQDNLSENRCKFYTEILDGVILAINQLSQNIDFAAKNEILTLIKELLNHIFIELGKESEVKKDIVFLPYKASMWDSLESIWQAAFDDKEHCNTYVIPIPYADRKPDQTVAKWNCEIDLFPKYVPVIDWRKINLEELHPDVIFIHNPYDNCNALTSVDAMFYSDELKKFTNKLVYVPYYVTDDIKPGDEKHEESIANLITTPAVLNSDLVIVQSENIRQVYINVLLRYSTQKDRKYWEDHIIGLGSPKYDKAFADKENLQIPKAWLKILKKPDKTFKKVVFFNLGLNSVQKFKEQFIDKVEESLNIFKEHKDEITLLWRPHPLFSSMISEMLPELKERYESIINNYKRDEWSIFDETPDINRALAMSDAYFGDGSSVAKLYAITGRPILYHNPKLKVDESELVAGTRVFKINNVCYEGSQIWCTAFCDPNLYKIDVENKKIDKVANILDDGDKLEAYIYILSYENYFIFIQSRTCRLIMMNRDNFQKSTYEIPSQNERKLRFYQQFVHGVIHNDNLYIFGLDYKGIIKFNLSTRKFSIVDDFLKNLTIRNFIETLSLCNYIQIEDKLFLPFANTNAVLEFSLTDDSAKVHYVGDEEQGYISGAFDGKNIWLAPRDFKSGSIVKWNIESNSVEQFKIAFEPKFKLDKTFKIGNYIVMLPSKGESGSNIKINLNTEEIEMFDDFFDTYTCFGDKYSCLNLNGSVISCIKDLNLIRYDFESGVVENIELTPSESVVEINRQIENDKLKFIFEAQINGTSIIIKERNKLNLHHLIAFLLSD